MILFYRNEVWFLDWCMLFFIFRCLWHRFWMWWLKCWPRPPLSAHHVRFSNWSRMYAATSMIMGNVLWLTPVPLTRVKTKSPCTKHSTIKQLSVPSSYNPTIPSYKTLPNPELSHWLVGFIDSSMFLFQMVPRLVGLNHISYFVSLLLPCR